MKILFVSAVMAASTVVVLSPSAGACDLSFKQRLQLQTLHGLPLNIPSGAMWPTLKVGDVIFADAIAPGGRGLGRGEIVVFCLEAKPETLYIKRVIGLPGDRVQIATNRVSVNGSEIGRTRIADGTLDDRRDIPCFEEDLDGRRWQVCQLQGDSGPAANMAERTLAADELFVLGDNRDNSLDSRHADSGYNPIGRVRMANLIAIFKPAK